MRVWSVLVIGILVALSGCAPLGYVEAGYGLVRAVDLIEPGARL